MAVTLHQAGYAVAVLNPKYVKKFAESLPRRSKTDALDADVLLRFATERLPSPWVPPPAAYHELRQRLMGLKLSSVLWDATPLKSRNCADFI